MPCRSQTDKGKEDVLSLIIYSDNANRRAEMLLNVYGPTHLCLMGLLRNQLWISSLVKWVVVLGSEYLYKGSRHQRLY